MEPGPAVADVLFRPSRGKAVLYLAGSLCAVALGIWMAGIDPWMGWACALFFGVGAIVFVLLLRPNSVYLRLHADGFELASLLRKGTTRWQDVAHIGVGTMNYSKVIAIVYTDAYRATRFGKGVGFALAGCDAVISNMYAAPIEEIVAALNAWKARADSAVR